MTREEMILDVLGEEIAVRLDYQCNCDLLDYSVEKTDDGEKLVVSVSFRWRPSQEEDTFTFLMPGNEPEHVKALDGDILTERILFKATMKIVKGEMIKWSRYK